MSSVLKPTIHRFQPGPSAVIVDVFKIHNDLKELDRVNRRRSLDIISVRSLIQPLPNGELASEEDVSLLFAALGVKGTNVTSPGATVIGVNGKYWVVPDSVTMAMTNLLVKLAPIVVKIENVAGGVARGLGKPVKLV